MLIYAPLFGIDCAILCFFWGFPGSSVVVKNPPANAGDAGSIPGWGRSPVGGNAAHSISLAWEIPWTEGPGGLQSMGSQKSWT